MTISDNKAKLSISPDLSALFLLSILANPLLNKSLLQPITNILHLQLQKKFPNLFIRMKEFSPATILIIPVELPFALLFSLNETESTLSYVDKDESVISDASVTASVSNLIKMLEGKVDGDALFFSRQLNIEGNTEIIVALRNILEAEDINLQANLISSLPFPKIIIEKTIDFHKSIFSKIENNIKSFQNACINPVKIQLSQLINDNQILSIKVNELEGDVIKLKNKLTSLQKKIRA